MHCLLMVTGRCFGWQRLNYAQCIAGTPPSACVMKEKNAIDCFSRCTVLSVPCCLTVSALRQTWERGSAYLGDSVSHSPTPAPADAKTKPPASLTVMERRSAEIPTAWVGGKRVCSRQARSGATGCLTPGSAQKSSCAWARRAGSAQGTGPGGLPGSTATFWRFSHQPDALNCHPQRGKPGQAGREGRARRAKGRRWPAVMTPREGGLRADDAVASHRAADGAGSSIEGARTGAGGTSRQAVAGFTALPSAAHQQEASPTSTPWINQARAVRL
jgi:hypothetical protein